MQMRLSVNQDAKQSHQRREKPFEDYLCPQDNKRREYTSVSVLSILKHERKKEQAVNKRWLAQPRCLWVNSKDNDPSDKCCSEDYLICFLSMS